MLEGVCAIALIPSSIHAQRAVDHGVGAGGARTLDLGQVAEDAARKKPQGIFGK
jgi:hypothetical protein